MKEYAKCIENLRRGKSEKSQISRNVIWLFLEKGGQLSITFFVSIIVIRYLGSADFGLLTYVLAITGIVEAFVGLGLRPILVRELVKRPEKTKVLLGTTFWLTLCSATLAMLLSISIICLLQPDDFVVRQLVVIYSLSFLMKSFATIAYSFESRVASGAVVPITMIMVIISSFIKLYLVYAEWPLIAFVCTLTLESVLLSMGLIWLYQREEGDIRQWSFDFTLAKELLRDSFPLMLSTFMIIIYMKIDQIMLKEMVSNNELGLYSVAVRLTEIWYFIPMVISQSFFPKIVQTHEKTPEMLLPKLKRLYNLLAFISYCVVIPICIFATPIVTFLYGEEFESSGIILSFLIWTIIPVCLGTVRGLFIMSMNFTVVYFLITCISTICNIILNWYLIPLYGALGAAIATLISYSFAAIFSCFIYRPLWSNGLLMLRALVWPKFL